LNIVNPFLPEGAQLKDVFNNNGYENFTSGEVTSEKIANPFSQALLKIHNARTLFVDFLKRVQSRGIYFISSVFDSCQPTLA